MSALASVGAIVPAADKINLSAVWTSFWNPVQTAIGATAVTLITVVGLVVLLSSIAMFIFQKRRGGGGNTTGLFWAAMFGALLIAPNILFPLLLQLADFVINGFISLLPAAT